MISKARHACGACRSLKRKCDRRLPACSLCTRLDKPCEYSITVTSPASVNNLSTTSADPCLHLKESDQPFPSRYFLESKSFIPVQPSNALDSTSQPLLEQAAAKYAPLEDRPVLLDDYFSTVHGWLPIISRKRFLRAAFTDPDACQDLLVLCMKLCITSPTDSLPAKNQLYILVRCLCSAAETSGLVSLRLVQSFILVTVYELCHAIFPTAYLTIGRAARLVTLVGWHDMKSQQLFKNPDTLTLREEQRRTWWAVYILDRCINAGTRGVPFAVPEPCQDEILPVNDGDWNQGRQAPNEALFTASFSTVTTLGPFARTCQAAHMLSKVITHKHAKRRNLQATAVLLEECRHLHQALAALQLSLEPPAGGDSGVAIDTQPAALAICITARYLLYNTYACRGFPGALSPGQGRVALETEMQSVSVEGLRLLTGITVRNLAQGRAECPLVANCFYQAALLCAWVLREDHDPAIEDALRLVLSGLERLGQRWKIAVEFMALLAQDGVLKLVGANNSLDATSTFVGEGSGPRNIYTL